MAAATDTLLKLASSPLSSPAALAEYVGAGSWKRYGHLQLVNEKLLQVAGRQIKRLAISMPPQHGKSELISHYFPAWYEILFPKERIILASHEAGFARIWGRKAREVVETYGPDLRGVSVRRDSKAANLWFTDQGGYMATAGIRGPVTGKGANGVIIDDPLKDAQDAASKKIKESQFDWMQSVARSRLARDGWIIIVATRWAKDDLIGRLTAALTKPGAEKWDVLNLPAIAEQDERLGICWSRAKGEPLCEELHPKKELEQTKSSIRAYWWSSIYQGRPTVKGGKLFKRSSWLYIDDPLPLSAYARLVRYWDKAATEADEGDDPDWTAGVLIGELEIPIKDPATGETVDYETEYHVLDVVRFREGPAGVRRIMRSTAERDGFDVMIRAEQEPGSSGKDVAYEFYDVFSGYAYKPERVTGSKSLRAESFAGAVENHRVRLVRGSWLEDWLEEYDDFPNGLHDDQVDSGSGAYRTLSRPGASVDFV